MDDTYVDGISVTYGQQTRNHIWTLAAVGRRIDKHSCPCINSTFTTSPFVNNDYFCEQGTPVYYQYGVFIADNPLWDDHGCTGSSTCCEFNNPPWFYKQLPEPTTEDIEIRILTFAINEYNLGGEDTPVQLIEIYVQ